MHIFCTKCGKHIDVSLEELENQSGHLVCPQCLAEIDVDPDLFNAKAPAVPSDDTTAALATREQEPPSHTPPAMPPTPRQPEAKPGATTPPPHQPLPHIDDVMRYCKHCGAFLKEGVNFCPKCGKYVRVTAPPPKPSLTAAQQEAAKLRASTPPARRVPANKHSTYIPPQYPPHHTSPVKQQQSSRNGNRRRAASKSTGSSPSRFSIHSIGGCLTLTIVAVALFFIIYIIIGAHYE